MSAEGDWAIAYARQARADYETWMLLKGSPKVVECHKLQFLQMTCEKVCKSHLVATGAPLESVSTSHVYVGKTLPLLIRNELLHRGKRAKEIKSIMGSVRRLCPEIGRLSPSVDDDGKRPDNCEYPWQDHEGKVHSPLDASFTPSTLLLERHGVTFIKLLLSAIERRLPKP